MRESLWSLIYACVYLFIYFSLNRLCCEHQLCASDGVEKLWDLMGFWMRKPRYGCQACWGSSPGVERSQGRLPAAGLGGMVAGIAE